MISDRGKGWILIAVIGALVWGGIYLTLGWKWEWAIAMMYLLII